MAELATGAVNTLLGVISHEALKLGRVRRDVQFIQEEMESMGSFLANLSGKSREQDEQVRTWMNQVRILANDCNNCIDLYLYRGDPALHLPKKGPGRYLRRAPWLLRKLLAKQQAADQLKELKDRAQDIGNRRLRYGVEVKPAESSSSGARLTEPLLLPAPQDSEDEEDDNCQDGIDSLQVALSMIGKRMDKEEGTRRRLDEWIRLKVQAGVREAGLLPSIAFVVTETKDANALVCVALAAAEDHHYFKLPPENKDVGALTHEDKAMPIGVLTHEDKAVPSENKDVGPLVHEDKEDVPPETKDGDDLHTKIRQCHRRPRTATLLRMKIRRLCQLKPRMWALLCVKIRRLCHRRPRTPVRPETKDIGALAHKDKHVPPETKDVDNALVHKDKIVAPETKDHSALVHEDKAVVAPNTKDADALADENEVVVPREAKDKGGAFMLHDKADVPPKTKDIGALAHEDKVVASPETKDAGPLAHEDKSVASPETKNAGALVHENKDVPPETKVVDTLAHQDKVVVTPETKSVSALAREEKADNKGTGNVVVLVDIPEVHYPSETLRPHKILCYILAELKRQQDTKPPKTRWGTYKYTKNQITKIKGNIKHVGKKIKAIKISELEDSKQLLEDLKKSDNNIDKLEGTIHSLQLGQLLSLLLYYSTTVTSEKDKKNKAMVEDMYDAIIKKTSKDLKKGIEAGRSISKMQESEYEKILQEVFPSSTNSTTIATTATSSPGMLVADGIKDIVKEVKEMMNELRGVDKSDKKQETGSEAAQMTPEAHSEEVTKKKREIKNKIRQQLKNKMMLQKIKECLGDDGRRTILVILKVHDKYVRQWEETRKSLGLFEMLECPIAGAVIMATTTREDSKQYFHSPVLQPIEDSLVGVYFDTVVQKTSNHMDDPEIHKILRNILCKCESDEFCMKIFAHALYAKPKRSSEELSKLHDTLPAGATQKSLYSVMLKFSYRDLPKQYRSCLLYLAIFPQGQTIRRSTLIGRWVAEGLITTKDWRWSSSVDEAETCFDTLVARCLVCPAGIGATGKVKSCTVDKLIYGFITKIARKQRILDTRLSHHLARHFSIFSDVRLRRSENIEDFLKNPSQFSKLKVLDLEGCHCFQHKNQHYLRDICRKMRMLKYLSLRRTDVTKLPREINNLHELEVLDIRETKIPASATRNVLLQKLKRLLAGHVDPSLVDFSGVQNPEEIEKFNVKPQNRLKYLFAGDADPSTSSAADFFSVQIPEKIEKMEGMEVLSNVKPTSKQDLEDIKTLNQLKKLGVAIEKESHLQPLLGVIIDLLNQSLRSLSITLDITRHKDTPIVLDQKPDCPNVLESLSINGSKKFPKDLESPSINKRTSTHMGKFLELLTKKGKQLAKVTLSCTLLSQKDLKVLAELDNLCCVKLRHNTYAESRLTFNKDEFKNLRKFLVEGTSMAEIEFKNGAASKLEKIVLSSTNIVSISGVSCLQKLEELELKGINNKDMLHSLLRDAKHIAKVTLHDTLVEQSDLKILARKQKMRHLALLGKFCNANQLIFKEPDFHKLNVLIVDSEDITEISFTDGSPNLEKIVWSFKNIVSLSGIDKLPALKELELNGDSVPNDVEEVIKKLKSRLGYKRGNKPNNQEVNKREPDGVARCPSLWKAKDWCWRN